MLIKDYLKNNILLTDGAFGTYYALKYGHDSVCERANIENPDRVLSIHDDYIRAGAKLLRTNTFAANKFTLDSDDEKRSEIIRKGYELAERSADGKKVFVAADIGPISSISESEGEISNEEKLEEYKKIIDVFLECGAGIFIFETMDSTVPLSAAVSYLKSRKKEAFVICQFALLPDSHTGSGISLLELIKDADNMEADVLGLNCASGPIHVLKHIRRVRKLTDKPLSALPNASYPERIEDRTRYSRNEKYFADIASEILSEGVKIIGGCCGTTPGHIKLIADAIEKGIKLKSDKKPDVKEESLIAAVPNIDLYVEISPPLKSSTKGFVNKIEKLKEMGVENITLPDSPLGKARMNPIIVSELVREKLDVNTLVHLCCRDRNITALRSDVLAAWALGLRKLLCVTGDPVAAGSRDNIKSVFNLTGTRLIELISHMNSEFFESDPIELFAAVDFSAPNFDVELRRAKEKAHVGAGTFFSQPIYSERAILNIKRLKEELDTKVYAGILPPVSYRNAQFLNNEVPGIRLPDVLLEDFKNAEINQQQTVGVKFSVDIAKRALEFADGIYLMLPFGKIGVAAQFFNLYDK